MNKIINILSIIIFTMLINNPVLAKTGKEVYDNYCTTCHSPSMAPMFNSPAANDDNAWNKRKEDSLLRVLEKNSDIKNASNEKKNEAILNELLNTALVGTPKGMPPKGTCLECSDDELKSAIEFMIPKK